MQAFARRRPFSTAVTTLNDDDDDDDDGDGDGDDGDDDC